MTFLETINYLKERNIFPGSTVTFSPDYRTFTFLGLTESHGPGNGWSVVLKPTHNSTPWVAIVTTHFSNIYEV